MLYEYKGKRYPDHLKQGNACQFIAPMAKKFCQGVGLDIGCSEWPLEGAIPIELKQGSDGTDLAKGVYYDYIFSSHCLEHLANPIKALKHWKSRLGYGGILFLYLPHPDMEYWLPQNNLKHLHSWTPEQMYKIFLDLGFDDVIYSERDLNWSFSIVGVNRAY